MIDNGFSIIICTYNGEKRLSETLIHLSNLMVPEGHIVELILVDNASTDNTKRFTEAFWENDCKSPFPLQIIEEKRAGKGYAVETGYDAAHYSYLLIVDDDNWLDPEYLVNSVHLFELHPDVGILQGKSEGVFEVEPPHWLHPILHLFVIGSPVPHTGYFERDNVWVWGAGMIIKKVNWEYIRSIGFSFLTSKVAGKAAGEDNETALAFLMMGKKIFYSDRLVYKHYMSKERITWERLEQNFRTFGYTNYYFFLYALVIDAYQKDYNITQRIVRRKFYKYWYKKAGGMRVLAIRLRYYFSEKHVFRLNVIENFTLFSLFFRLKKNSLQDVASLQSWMRPLFEENELKDFDPFRIFKN